MMFSNMYADMKFDEIIKKYEDKLVSAILKDLDYDITKSGKEYVKNMFCFIKNSEMIHKCLSQIRQCRFIMGSFGMPY